MLNQRKQMADKNLNVIGTDMMRKKMGEVLDSVYFKGDEFIIERKDKHLAAIMPVEKYNSINNFAKKLMKTILASYSNPNLSEQEVDEVADEVKHLIKKSK